MDHCCNRGIQRQGVLNMAILSLQDLGKSDQLGGNTVHALRGVTLDIELGEFVAITGPSGSGKSTLMHILGCLDRPTRGRLLINNRDVSNLSRSELAEVRNKEIGFVFQGFNLLPRTTAVENVEVPLLYSRTVIASAQRRRRAMEALESMGLAERAHHHPNQLSGGQQQRVAIARALVNKPSILLADEQAGHLRPRTPLRA